MTPERLAEIRQLLTYEPNCIAYYGSNGIYQFASDVRTGAMQLLATLDTLTAENATLRTRLDALVTAARNVKEPHKNMEDCDCQTCGDIRYLHSCVSAAVTQAKGEK